jgi:alcohol dehydrogenase (cytochrome c)
VPIETAARGLVVVWVGLLSLAAFSEEIVIGDGERPTFSNQQSRVGSLVYQQYCSSCHSASLAGGQGPAIAGADFMHRWAGGQRTVGDLYALIRGTMPKEAPGSLSEEQYENLVAYLLAQNGFKAGEMALGPQGMDTRLLAAAAPSPAGTEVLAEPRPDSFPGDAKIYGTASTQRPSDLELLQNSDANWLMYNKGYSGQRYSGLDQIKVGNAGHLAPQCVFQTGEVTSFEPAPVVDDGVMYITTPWNTYAVEAGTCELVWQSHHKGSTSLPVNRTRSVSLYRGSVFRSTPDGHLLALDAKSGKVLWDVWMSDAERGYWLSAAPIAFDGKVFMGEAGADWGADAHVFAFDAATGRALWKFNVIPTGDEVGADSWLQGSAHGGGSIWSTFALEPTPQGGLLFVSVGNPAPDFNSALRPGDNLFTDTVVVLDARSGKLVWYAQQIPHDTHDWDTAAAPVLYDKGAGRYMAVVNKGGWLYIYDRDSHRLVAKAEISKHLNADAPITKRPLRICPGNLGGAAWNGPAFSPRERLLFVNSTDWCGEEKLAEPHFIENSSYLGGTFTFDPIEQGGGWIRAFDATTGRQKWQQRMKRPMVGGLTATAGGIVFTGTGEGDFLVLNARTGDVLYRFHAGGAIAGAPSTFQSQGRQYVAVPVSGGPTRSPWGGFGAASVFLFALPAAALSH